MSVMTFVVCNTQTCIVKKYKMFEDVQLNTINFHSNQAWIVLQWVNISLHDQINILIYMILVLSVIKRCLITFKWLHLFIEFRQFNRSMFRSKWLCNNQMIFIFFTSTSFLFFSFVVELNWTWIAGLITLKSLFP